MAISEKADFLRMVRASRVIAPEKLNGFLQQTHSEDARHLAKELVSAGLLTPWQAKFLFTGRHQLLLGNYVLQERIRRDEMGDRFLARHRQLGREVEIQILPAELKQQPERKQAFLDRSRLVATLDHPNLMHVLDIDEEGGRLYLVAEKIDGRALSEYRLNELNSGDVARLVTSLLSGLELAHQNGLTHGRIHPENVWVTDQGTVKIRKLVLAALADLAVPAQPIDDFNNVGQLGRRILSKVGGESRSPGRKALFELLSDLATARPEDLETLKKRLSDWLATFGGEPGSIRTAVAGLDDRWHTSVSDRTEQDSEKVAVSAEQTPAAEAARGPSTYGENETPNQTATHRPDSGPALLLTSDPSRLKLIFGTLIVAGLLVIAAITWILANRGDRPSDSGMASRNRVRSAPRDQPARPGSKLEVGEEMKKELDRMRGGPKQGPDRSGLSGKPSPPAEKSDNNEVEDTTNVDTEADASETPDSGSGTNIEAAGDSSVEKETEKGSTGEPADPPGDVTKDEPMANMAPEKTAESERPDPKPVQPPFAGLPPQVSLPPRTETGEVELAHFPIGDGFLLHVELIAGPEIGRQPVEIRIDADPNAPQQWFVSGNPRGGELEQIARIRYADSDEGGILFFQWAENLEDRKHEWVEYVRNGLLKLVADEERLLPLRKPVLIANNLLPANNKDVSIPTGIDWLPEKGSIRVELLPLTIGDLENTSPQQPEEVGEPGSYPLSARPDAPNLLRLEVITVIRRSRSLELNLGLKHVGQAKSAEDFSQVAAEMKNRADLLSLQAGNLGKLPDESSADFDVRKKNAEALAKQAQTVAAEYMQVAERLTHLPSTPIPLVIFYELEGNRVFLGATSPEHLEAVRPVAEAEDVAGGNYP